MKRFIDSFGFGLFLNLILPGSGHIYYREYIFGIFVSLVLLMVAVLFYLTFLVDLPLVVKLVLFGLPAVFYLFSFVDLWRSVNRNQPVRPRTRRAAGLFLVVGLAANLLIPVSPTNFLLRNSPEILRVSGETLMPLLDAGDVCWVDRMAYRVNLFFLDGPIGRAEPDRGDIVKFRLDGIDRIGLVVGLGGEAVALVNDSLFVDGLPTDDRVGRLAGLRGELPLTQVDFGLILAVTLADGAVAQKHHVPARQISGEVHRLF